MMGVRVAGTLCPATRPRPWTVPAAHAGPEPTGSVKGCSTSVPSLPASCWKTKLSYVRVFWCNGNWQAAVSRGRQPISTHPGQPCLDSP